MSQIYSQTSLQTSNKLDSVIVPVKTLRNALIVMEQRNACREQLSVVRDSIVLQNKLILNRDTVINNLNYVKDTLKNNQQNYIKIISNKDKEITVYKDKYEKEKLHKWFGIGGGVILFLISFLF